MAETMSALECLNRFAEAAPDDPTAKAWRRFDNELRNWWAMTTAKFLADGLAPDVERPSHFTLAGIVAATRALAAREEQVRREALVEGARWMLAEVRRQAAELTTQMVTVEQIDYGHFDPAAVLESEKGKP